MTALLHISDLHFGTEIPAAVEALRQLHATIRPDLLVASGDITQRATRRQFDRARAFFASLSPERLLVLPGNHDIPLFNFVLRALDPYRRWREVFGPELEPLHDDPALLVIGVNTVRARWHKDGAVSAPQIARVTHRLTEARPGQLRVVVTHQPADVIRPQDRGDRLIRADAALRAWVAAGADLVLGGHIHLPYVLSLGERYPELRREAWLAQAGTAVSRRTLDGIPNSVNLIRCGDAGPTADGNTLSIERWDYDEAGQRFRPGRCHRLALSPLDGLPAARPIDRLSR